LFLLGFADGRSILYEPVFTVTLPSGPLVVCLVDTVSAPFKARSTVLVEIPKCFAASLIALARPSVF
jgi:hypothetical protein